MPTRSIVSAHNADLCEFMLSAVGAQFVARVETLKRDGPPPGQDTDGAIDALSAIISDAMAMMPTWEVDDLGDDMAIRCSECRTTQVHFTVET